MTLQMHSFRVWSSTFRVRAPGSLQVEQTLGVAVNMSVELLLDLIANKRNIRSFVLPSKFSISVLNINT